ncbi:MAG TPA: hypothetical protein VF573_00750 [Paraburkholderia sp.]|uniref:hypothetical protein n=1 Tax=Paraburkholderia sp. TaxID=1926495 RepID=UPI002ED4901F
MAVDEQQVLSIVARHDPVTIPDLVVKSPPTSARVVGLHRFVSLHQFIGRGKRGHAFFAVDLDVRASCMRRAGLFVVFWKGTIADRDDEKFPMRA